MGSKLVKYGNDGGGWLLLHATLDSRLLQLLTGNINFM
jgi:hypothetical protein